MRASYVITGAIMLVLAFLSLTNQTISNIFFNIFGILSIVGAYVIGMIGFWVLIIGFMKD
mgnify:CR=1 FL=1